MTTRADDPVLQLALDKGLLSPAQLESVQRVISRQAAAGGSPRSWVDAWVGEGVLTGWQAAALQAEWFGLETVDLSAVVVADDLLAQVPQAWAERHRLVPLARNAGELQIAVCDPLDTAGADSLAHRLGVKIATRLAPAEEIARAIERLYRPAATGAVGEASDPPPQSPGPHADAADQSKPGASSWAGDEDAPVIRLVHALIHAAIDRRASDIHLEPLGRRLRVRYRIDGVLVEVDGPPPRLQSAILSRVKLMANISIAEKRLPQDGRIQLSHAGRPLDLRVSTLPTSHGESLVLRVLDQESLKRGLPELGLSPEQAALLEQWITRPDGILLVTGPTGSGKTTTLYGCLHHLNTGGRKIITVEDPVEYQLSGINQVPVRPEVGLTFGAALRAMLRQAPNVIMVGEIRDGETAGMAVHASLTGHLVLSTLHTNDAPGAVPRMVNLGIAPFLLAASLRGILAQRLVRKICGACRQPFRSTLAELRALGLNREPGGGPVFMRGRGCAACHGSGYHGRIGIFELLEIDDDIRSLIHAQASLGRLRAKARARGLVTLREDGARKVSAGLTTVEEVVSITVGDAS